MKSTSGEGGDDGDDAGGFGGEGEEGGDGGGGALVDVGGVEVEGDGGDFVADADDDHEQADEGERGTCYGLSEEPAWMASKRVEPVAP